jgi:hypothetical protein
MGDENNNNSRFGIVEEEAQKGNLLRPETEEFLQRLNAFWECQRSMKETAERLDPNGMLQGCEIKTHSGGLVSDESTDGSLHYKAEYQQQSIRGETIKNLPELYEAAQVAVPFFQFFWID